MFSTERKNLGLIIGLGGWFCLLIFSRIVAISPQLRITVLILQQLLFFLGGYLGCNKTTLIKPTKKELKTGLIYGLGLYLSNIILANISLYATSVLLGSELAQNLMILERNNINYLLLGSGRQFYLVSLMLVVGAPLSEEFFFRGLIQGKLQEKTSTSTAVFLTAFSFAILHFYLIQFLPVFVAGIFLGLMFVRSKKIIIPIIAHSVANSLALLAWLLLL